MDHGATRKKARVEGGDLHVASQERRRQEALQGVRNGTVDFRQLSAELRDDAEIALAAIRKDGFRNSESVSERLKSNKAFVLAAVKVYGWFLLYDASEELRGDREIVWEAVRENGMALWYASEGLRGDREVVLAAVRQDGSALEYAVVELRGNHEIVLAAILENGCALEFASEELRGNHEIVLAAVQQNGSALEYAVAELRGNHEIVLAAIQENGCALEYASEELRGNHEVVLEAVRHDGMAFMHASEDLRGDREIALTALVDSTKDIEEVEENISRDLWNDPMVAAAIIRLGGCLRKGSEIVERLENVLLAVRALPEQGADFINVVNEDGIVESSSRWERSIWHRIWMVLQLEPPGMDGTGRLFVELSGLSVELGRARDLRDLAPVIAEVSSFWHDWTDLDTYPVSEHESDP